MQCVMLRGSRRVCQIGRILSGGRDGSMEPPENRILSIKLIVWSRLDGCGRGGSRVGCGCGGLVAVATGRDPTVKICLIMMRCGWVYVNLC